MLKKWNLKPVFIKLKVYYIGDFKYYIGKIMHFINKSVLKNIDFISTLGSNK